MEISKHSKSKPREKDVRFAGEDARGWQLHICFQTFITCIVTKNLSSSVLYKVTLVAIWTLRYVYTEHLTGPAHTQTFFLLSVSHFTRAHSAWLKLFKGHLFCVRFHLVP